MTSGKKRMYVTLLFSVENKVGDMEVVSLSGST
jgi:hypothetical protein